MLLCSNFENILLTNKTVTKCCCSATSKTSCWPARRLLPSSRSPRVETPETLADRQGVCCPDVAVQQLRNHLADQQEGCCQATRSFEAEQSFEMPLPNTSYCQLQVVFLAIVPSCFLLPYFDPKHQKRGAHRFETEHMKYIDIQI